MEKQSYIKVFASLGIYFGLIPKCMVDENNLKGATASQGEDDRLYSNDLSGVDVSALYLMQHIDDGCIANCAFCIQAADNKHKRKKAFLVDKEMIRLPLNNLKQFLANSTRAQEVRRICIQTIFNKKTVENLFELVSGIRQVSSTPITACCIPISKESMIKLKNAGLDHITINYETATPELFSKIRGKERKGPYRWEVVGKALADALDVYGDYNVGSHLQIGLGETQEEALRFVQEQWNNKIIVSLFAFTPVEGTAMENATRSTYKYFHQVQLGSFLIRKGIVAVDGITFDSAGNITDYGIDEKQLIDFIESGIPFRNAGCPDCNRVYYETNPGERSYSYPRPLSKNETETIKQEILG